MASQKLKKLPVSFKVVLKAMIVVCCQSSSSITQMEVFTLISTVEQTLIHVLSSELPSKNNEIIKPLFEPIRKSPLLKFKFSINCYIVFLILLLFSNKKRSEIKNILIKNALYNLIVL